MDIQIAYRDHKIGGSSSDSDSDSNDESDVWKRHSSSRAKQDTTERCDLSHHKQASSALPPVNLSKKRKVNDIWSNVLQEETVVTELCGIGLDSKCPDSQNRNCESYNYKRKYSDPRREQNMEIGGSGDDSDLPSHDARRKLKSKGHRKYRSTESLSSFSKKKGDNDMKKRFPKLCPSDVEVARKIVRALGEPKHYLIYRVVHEVGAEKAIKLLKMTEDVEEQGGMLIKNNTRRRTPGGVYFQLLKSDKDVTAEQVEKIFAFEIPLEKYKEFRKLQGKLKKHQGNKMKNHKNKSKHDSKKRTKMFRKFAAAKESTVESSPQPSIVSESKENCGNGVAEECLPFSSDEIQIDVEEGEILET